MQIFTDIHEILTLQGAAQKAARAITELDLSIIPKAALVVDKGKVQWVGPRKRLPKTFARGREISLNDQIVLPGFVECHTHSVFAGHRFSEFELRNQGVSYQEIAAKGGGILSTMKATRKASAKELRELTERRIREFVSQGVTTLEIKSGYALDFANELKTLKVIQDLKEKSKMPTLVPTFLGAHSLPPEFKTTEDYLVFLQDKVLPAVKKKGLAKRVDAFIEKGFFAPDSTRKYFQKAQELGFDVTVHADQLSLSGGAEVAVKLQAQSADHLIQIDDMAIKRLAESEVTCVLLPAADLYMRCAYPPARKLLAAGARVALATDFNPGSSPTQDLMLVGLLARLEMKMTLPEVIAAYTLGGAFSLGMSKSKGSLEVGKDADFLCIDQEWQSLFYKVGERPVTQVFHSGKSIF